MTLYEDVEASDGLMVRMTNDGYREYFHWVCGKRWLAKTGDLSPNYCPECGTELFDESN